MQPKRILQMCLQYLCELDHFAKTQNATTYKDLEFVHNCHFFSSAKCVLSPCFLERKWQCVNFKMFLLGLHIKNKKMDYAAFPLRSNLIDSNTHGSGRWQECLKYKNKPWKEGVNREMFGRNANRNAMWVKGWMYPNAKISLFISNKIQFYFENDLCWNLIWDLV